MRKLLSRPEQDDCGTSQTSIRHQPLRRRAMREYAVAPIHTGGVAMRHVGPRDATSVPLSILTWNLADLSLLDPSRRAPLGRRHGRGEIRTGGLPRTCRGFTA